MLTRRVLLAPPSVRRELLSRSAPCMRPIPCLQYSSSPQSVTQPSFWASLVPKPLRQKSKPFNKVTQSESKGWNPATFYIVIFLLIGSMSIQMIALRNDFATFTRRADAKVDLLREIIERVQRGEEVDVEGLLGTGDPEREKEWEEVLKEIEKEDEILRNSHREKRRKFAASKENDGASSKSASNSDSIGGRGEQDATRPEKRSNAPSGFY